MKIGIVGYQAAGKSTLFHWLTSEEPSPALAHLIQSAMTAVPESRVAKLCEIYKPKKITLASLELVDTPGLSRDHAGSAQKLAMIREAGCLIVVVGAYAGSDARTDLTNFEDDLLIADLDIVAGRVDRLKDQVRKPRPNRDELVKELESLEPIHAALNEGTALRDLELNADQQKAIRSFQLFSEKPRMVVVNTPDDETDFDKYQTESPPETTLVALPLALECGLMQMEPAERDEFCEEMGVAPADRDALVRQIMEVSQQMLFFTAGEKEVRTWMIHKGGTAVEAAGNIHTDLARGFIRAETMTCDDLLRLGSEREVKAANLVRKEHREYVIQDGDIITIQHN